MEAGECVKVGLRCRPMSSDESKEGYEEIVYIDGPKGEVYLRDPETPNEKPRMFTFDFAFDKSSSQKTIFEKSAKEIVDFVIKGYNGTIFAYGQTGTGKTHTMQGGSSPEDHGITPRSFRRIFDIIKKSEKTQYLVSASMYELYNEEVNDLLNLEGKNLKIKENPDKGFYIQDLDSKIVKNEDELMHIMELGNKNRKTSATAMNKHSSRSHCIFVVTVESQTTTENGAVCYTSGKLNLVDLAGSEKQKKTDIKSAVQKAEAIKINLSLTTLRKCINELVKAGSGHVSFRDSNLTKLLKDSLGGNTKTVMIANIGPASYNKEESLSTLKYAYGAKSIKNKPKINEDPQDTMIRKYNEEIEQLRIQLAAMASGNSSNLDPKALMGLLGNNNNDDEKMAEMIQTRQGEIEKKKQDLDLKRQDIEKSRKQRLKNGENAEKIEKELSEMENIINKQEVELDEENLQKAKLLDELNCIQERMVMGDKEKEKVEKARQELESYRKQIQGNSEAFDAIERVHKEEAEKQDKLERKVKDMQTQLSQYDKEINQKNMELTRLNAEIQNQQEKAAMEKERLMKELGQLSLELLHHEKIIKSLVPFSVEQILTSLVEWNEKTQQWDMIKNQKIEPRYQRPFSIHGLKKPTLSIPGAKPEYQNYFVKNNRQALEYWKDKMPNEEDILKGDIYLENQIMQMNPEDLEVFQINTAELDQLEREILERETRELEEANRKVQADQAKDSDKKEDKQREAKAKKKEEAKPKPAEELYPEARGKRKGFK